MKSRMIDPTWQVEANSDDCYRGYNGAYWDIANASVGAGYWDINNQDVGAAFRFDNIAIPPGSTINSAYLSLYAYSDYAGDTVNTRIRAQLDADGITFSDAVDFDARAWTAEYMNWDAIGHWAADNWYDSPTDDGVRHFKDIIQAVIDLAGWNSGQAIVIAWEDWQERSTQANGTNRIAEGHTHEADKAAKLVIAYTPPAAAGRSSGYIIG